MGWDLHKAFAISFDGLTKRAASIEALSVNYLRYAHHALVKNELFVFGGIDEKRIAKLEKCEWKKQSSRLLFEYESGSAALSIEKGEKALICFDNWYHNKCEVFDGESSHATSTSKFRHRAGKLGFYKGKPTTVGDFYGSRNNKVESLDSNGWSSLSDFPESETAYHVLMGLPSGSLLLAGGTGYLKGSQSAIWLLQNDIWKKIGDLENPDSSGSAIMIKNSIFIVSGMEAPFEIERLDFEGDEMLNQRVIEYTDKSMMPVLYEVPVDYCV